MQRQKTIAKWLVIILLCTVAVGAYIMYDALYVTKGSGADAGDAQPVLPPSSDEQPPHESVFTELPRPTQNFAGMQVAHTGGEGDDILLDAVFTSEATYLFFSSSSAEYDCRGAGLYVAVWKDDSLIAVTRFAEKDSVFGGGKLTADGVAALISEGGEGSLVVFDAEGSEKGRCALPGFTSAFTLLNGNALTVFSAEDGKLGCHTVEKGLTVTHSPFFLSGKYEVAEGVVIGEDILLFAREGEDVAVIRFSHKDGFNVVKRYENCVFRQIVPLAGEDAPALCMLAERQDGMLLAVIGSTGAEEASTVADGVSEGALFADGVSVTLLHSGGANTYCRHLDLIASAPSALSVGRVIEVAQQDDLRLFASCDDDGRTTVMLSENGTDFSPLLAYDGDGRVMARFADGELLLAFSTSSSDGIYFESFGGADAYFVTAPL